MGFLSSLFGLEHSIVSRAKRSENVSTEVWGVYIRHNRRDDDYGVGVYHGANERPLTFEFYNTYEDAQDAAAALANYYGVGVEG